MTTIKKSDVTGSVARYDTLKALKHRPEKPAPPEVDVSTLADALPDKATLTSLQAGIRHIETLFSDDCNCLTNPDCCQTCQSSRCQSCQRGGGECSGQCYNCDCGGNGHG